MWLNRVVELLIVDSELVVGSRPRGSIKSKTASYLCTCEMSVL